MTAIEALRENKTIVEKYTDLAERSNFQSDDYAKNADKYQDNLTLIAAALTELEEIKKRAEEYINRLEEEKRKPYHMLLLGEDEVIKLIDHIIKGEGKQ